MDAGGTSPRMGEVDCAGSWRSRATPGAVAEGRGEGQQRNKCPYPRPLFPVVSRSYPGRATIAVPSKVLLPRPFINGLPSVCLRPLAK